MWVLQNKHVFRGVTVVSAAADRIAGRVQDVLSVSGFSYSSNELVQPNSTPIKLD